MNLQSNCRPAVGRPGLEPDPLQCKTRSLARALPTRSLGAEISFDHLRRSLHELDQHTATTDWVRVAPFRMDEGNVVPRRSLSDAARGKADARRLQMLDSGLERVDPQANVIPTPRSQTRMRNFASSSF